MAITVTVVLFATLGRYNPTGKGSQPFPVTMPSGSTVGSLLEKLEVKGEAKKIFIDHRSRENDFPLQDGRRVAIFPPIAGG